MRTIGGGTVRYVDVRLLPCPEDPARVGQCEGAGRLDLMWHDRVVDSVALRAGDELLVGDGAEVEPGTELVARDWLRSLRAAVPAGVDAVVQWSEPLEPCQSWNGDAELRFARGVEPMTLALVVHGEPLVRRALDRSATPVVDTGATVRRGDRIARLAEPRRGRELVADISTVRAFLDGHRLPGESVAQVAPCDATVRALGPRSIVLEGDDGRVLHLRLPPRAHVLVSVGDTVLAGDPLTGGERDHRALLHAWGEHRLSEHILDELRLICGDAVPRVYWALALRAMIRRDPAGHPRLRGIGAIARELRRS